MPKVRPFEPSMFSELFETFLQEDDEILQREDWHRLFCRPGSSTTTRGGYVLEADGRIVGVLGTIYSDRPIQGGMHRFCNLHTWNVREEHRGHSLFLMQRVMADRRVTLTDFTPTKLVTEISRRLGFRGLNSRLKVLLPLSPKKSRDKNQAIDILDEVSAVHEHTDDHHRRIMLDHTDSPCQHLLVCTAHGNCHVVFSPIDRWRIPYAYLHYISNEEVFLANHRRIRATIMAKTCSRFVALDARRVSRSRIPWSFELPIGSRQLVRSSSAQPHQIDTLYSELSLLRLTTMPNLSTVLASIKCVARP